MDLGGFYAAAWRDLDPVNPVSAAALDSLLDAADLRPGMRALELGCGPGRLAVRLARRGLSVDAVEVSEPVLALARETLDRAPAAVAARVRLRRARAETVLAENGPAYDLIVCAGAYGLIGGGATDPSGAWAVRRRLAEDGTALLADTVWRGPVPAAWAEVMPGYGSAADYLARAAQAELRPSEERRSRPQDWAAYLEGMLSGVRANAAERPGDPAAEAFVGRMEAVAALWRARPDERPGFVSWLLRPDGARVPATRPRASPGAR